MLKLETVDYKEPADCDENGQKKHAQRRLVKIKVVPLTNPIFEDG